jgi:RND family efflux transporter MFP subunit
MKLLILLPLRFLRLNMTKIPSVSASLSNKLLALSVSLLLLSACSGDNDSVDTASSNTAASDTASSNTAASDTAASDNSSQESSSLAKSVKMGSALTESAEPKKVWSTLLVPAKEGRKRHLTGSTQAADAVAISFEVNGVISKMQVDLGQGFKKGDVLAELDTAVYELNVQQNTSSLGEAKAALVDAEQTFERNKTLRKQGLVSQAALDNAKATYDIALQRAEVAQSALSLAKENLSDTQLIAPYDGRVSARFVEPNQQVAPGTAVFPEGLISKVALLDQVDIVVLAVDPTKKLPATLTEIGARASVANAFPITITLNDNYPGLFPGMSAEVIMQIQSEFDVSDLYEVPFSAFTTDKDQPYIYLIKQDTSVEGEKTDGQERAHYKVKRINIDIKELKADTAIIKLLGEDTLIADEKTQRIVRTGINFLRDGQAVSIVENDTRIYNQ